MSAAAAAFYCQIWDGITGPPKATSRLRISTHDDGITLVELNNPPVNIISIQLCEELYEWLRWLAVDSKTKAVLITSAIADHFCAGGDLAQVVNPTKEDFRTFWTGAQKLWIVAQSYSKPILVVASGTTPGMGCALVLCADYRVMVRGPQVKLNTGDATADSAPMKPPPFLIGFNEGAFGICLPSSYASVYVDVVGLRTAERMLTRGTLVTADEAVRLGIVDAAVDDKEAGLKAAREYVELLLKVPAAAFAKQRRMIRERYIKALFTEEGREAEVDFMFDSMTNPSAQAAIQAYVASLHKRAKGAKP